MAERAYFSKHISQDSMDAAAVQAVQADIALFNQIKWTATGMEDVNSKAERTAQESPDLRKKENKALRDKQKPSAHVQLKQKYGVDDHFVNSAVNCAKASIKSAKTLKVQRIDELNSQMKDLKHKISGTKSQLTRMKNIKKQMIRCSRHNKKYKPSGMRERYNETTNCYEILGLKRNADGQQVVLETYSDAYLFELQYVTPHLKRYQYALQSLQAREERLKQQIEGIKADPAVHICYGTKKLFHQQYGDKYPNHQTWLRAWKKKRSNSMMISGRKDAAQGNFRFRYDTAAHELTYYSQQVGTDGKQVVVTFPDVVFPYGQESIDKAVSAESNKRHAVAWRITQIGNSFLIQCMVYVSSDSNVINDYCSGCVAMDTNVDNLAISELDGSGNVVRHKIVHFNLENCSSGHAEQILSTALDEVFEWCDETGKPFAMENLDIKHPADRYGSKRRNAITSRFACSTVTKLVDSKAVNYSAIELPSSSRCGIQMNNGNNGKDCVQ